MLVSITGWSRSNDGVLRFSIALLLVIAIVVVPIGSGSDDGSADDPAASEYGSSPVAPDVLYSPGYFVDRSLEAAVMGEPMYTVAVWLHVGDASSVAWEKADDTVWYDMVRRVAPLQGSFTLTGSGVTMDERYWEETGSTWYLYSNRSQPVSVSVPGPVKHDVMKLSAGGTSRRFERASGDRSWEIMVEKGVNRISVGPVTCVASENTSCAYEGDLEITRPSLLDPAAVEYIPPQGKALTSGNFSLLEHDTGLYDWEGEDPSYRWMKDEKTIDIIADKQGWIKLDLTAKAFLEGRLGVSLGDASAVVSLSPNTFESEELWFRLDEGRNKFTITPLSCVRPGEVTAGSTDARCLAVALANVTMTPRSMLPTDRTFLPKQSSKMVSERVSPGWNNIDVQGVSRSIRSVNTSISVRPIVSVSVQNRTIRNYRGYGAGGPFVVSNRSAVVPFRFTESLVCVEKEDNVVSCGHPRMQGKRVVSEGASLDFLTFRYSFYDWEERDGRPFTWLERPMWMEVYVRQGVPMTARFNTTSFDGNGGTFAVGDTEIEVDGSAVNTTLELEAGRHRVSLVPERCTFPATVIDGSTDWRCLSIGFLEMALQMKQ